MGNITLDGKKAFHDMLVMDILRGKHSTGVAAITSNGVCEVIKKAVNAVDFLDFNTYKTEMGFAHNCLIGHNRYATKGAVNNVNAHPFDFDNIVGAHNGTLRAYAQLDDAKSFEVDSECLYSHLNTHGFKDTFEKITGAFALSWFDKETNELNLVRNNERPLCYCFSEDLCTLFWASEPWMLRGALARNDINFTDIVYLKEDVLYKFEMPTVYATKGIKLKPPTVRKYEKPKSVVVKKKQPSYSYSGNTLAPASRNYVQMKEWVGKTVEFVVDGYDLEMGGAGFITGFLGKHQDIEVRAYPVKGGALWCTMLERMDLNNFKGLVKSITWANNAYYLLMDLRSVEEVTADNVIEGDFSNSDDVEVTVEGYQGEKLNYTEFKAATDKGCAWCGDVATFDNSNIFVGSSEFVCKYCQMQEDVMGYLDDAYSIGD